MQPYPAYKPSGVAWLDDVPAHWEVKRLKRVCRINPPKSEIADFPKDTEVSFVPMELVGNGTLTLERTKHLQDVWLGFTYFRERDLLIAKITPSFENGKGAFAFGLANGIGFGTTELHVIRAGDSIDSKFLYYLTISYSFRMLGASQMYGTAGQKRVPDSFINDFQSPIPPLPEQRAIAAFLAAQTAKIDSLLAKKERLVELLKEKRTALINHAVTKGLDPQAEMKESGGAWLGKIPKHWDVKRLKFITLFITSGSRGWAQHYSDDGALFLRIGNLSRTSIDLELNDIQRVRPPSGAEVERIQVKEGDVLISVTAYIGSIGVVAENIGEAYVNQHIALTRPQQSAVMPRWLAYCLLSQVGQNQFRGLLYGGTKEGLSLEDVKGLIVLLPSAEEQHAIAAYLDRETAKIDRLIAKVGEAMERLREYRAAIIAAAVTGKVDVTSPLDSLSRI